MSEENRERKEKGMLYDPLEFVAQQEEYRKYVRRFNRTDSYMIRQQMLPEIFAEVGNSITSIEPPFYASWGGKHIHLGSNVLLSTNITFLDDADIYIEDGVMIGSGCNILTCSHPVSPKLRALSEGKIRNYAKPIRICRDAWIGAGVSIMPGVTVGQHSVIGSGSVVTSDIPADVIAYGNPCRVIRKISQKDDSFTPERIKARMTPAVHQENRVDVTRERIFYRDFPSSAGDLPDFREKFLALVSGLDETSVTTVTRALTRITRIRETDSDELPLYTPDEMKELRSFEERHLDVIRLAEDCWYYRGYMLPENFFEACVFEDRCGAGSLTDPDALKGKDIIDAGAFLGDSALVLSGLTDGRVHAFEPSADNYRKLLKTIELNHADRIVPVRKALGAEIGTAVLQNSVISSTHTLVKNDGVPYLYEEGVEVTTLDDYVREHHLKVGLIKADVEGAEQLLLKGADETIRTQKPAMLISIYHHADDFFGIKPMLEKRYPWYEFRIRHPAIGSALTETMLICSPKEAEA